jgi:hypothetical protein
MWRNLTTIVAIGLAIIAIPESSPSLFFPTAQVPFRNASWTPDGRTISPSSTHRGILRNGGRNGTR